MISSKPVIQFSLRDFDRKIPDVQAAGASQNMNHSCFSENQRAYFALFVYIKILDIVIGFWISIHLRQISKYWLLKISIFMFTNVKCLCILFLIWIYLHVSGRYILLNMSIMISVCTKGPLKQCGGGNNVQRWAAAGGNGKLPP